jgi:molybdopterin converting factor small subunit
MQVKVIFTGLMRHYAGQKEKTYDLPEGARVSDLMLEVGREYGPRLPGQMWDARNERFHRTIVATRKGSPPAGNDEALKAGDDIYILSRMAGG